MTIRQFVDAFNNATPEQCALAMESLPTDVLEFAVRFESLAQASRLRSAERSSVVTAEKEGK